MKILAFDTSSPVGSIAVLEDGRVAATRTFEIPRGRGAKIFTALQELRPIWSGCDRIAVGTGPGAYNGLRASCALAQSLQMALGTEIVAVPSPCLLPVPDSCYRVAGDARGGRFYFAEVRDRGMHGEVRLLTREEFEREIHADQSAPIYRIGTLAGFEGIAGHFPDAAVLASLALRLPPTEPASFGPIYLKPPHITQPHGARP